VGHLLAELGHRAGIGVSGSDVCALPADPVDLIADIVTENIVALDLSQTQMGIVHTDKDNTLPGGGIDDHTEVELSTSEWSLSHRPIVALSLSASTIPI